MLVYKTESPVQKLPAKYLPSYLPGHVNLPIHISTPNINYTIITHIMQLPFYLAAHPDGITDMNNF